MNGSQTSKLIMAVLVAAALAGVVVGVSSCKEKVPNETNGQAVKYTCAMHSEVVQDKPGNCPRCGMKLAEKK